MIRQLLVTYDLRKPGRNYDGLISAIEKAPGYARLLKSVWLISTTESTAVWRDRLMAHIDSNDGLAVLDAPMNDWATFGIDAKVIQWMQAVS